MLSILISALLTSATTMGGESTQWFYSNSPHGVVLVVGGLNLKTSRMDSLALTLKDHGFDVLRLALDGHSGNLEEFKLVTLAKWQTTFSQGNSQARTRATRLQIPFYYLGYSLGALLELLEQSPPPAAQILFAPPLSLRARSFWIKWLRIFGKSFVVPSLSPEAYRANRGTPIAAYDALFDAEDELKENGPLTLKVPTLIFSDPEDELVDAQESQALFDKSQCPDCQWINLMDHKKPHHLIIDEEALGTETWKKVQTQLLNFLETHRGPSTK